MIAGIIAPAMRRPPWWLAVFVLALLARAGYVLWLVEPLLYTPHFERALAIAEHGQPLQFVLRSDAWRSWGSAGSSGWTLAPLYYLFAATLLKLFGPSVKAIQLAQCLLEALTALGVARLGRTVAGPLGAWAGVAYAVHWQSIAFHAGADTENIHTVLLVFGLALLAEPGAGRLANAAGGFLLGASALARPVALAFLPCVAVQQARALGWRRGLARAALTLAGCLLAVLPWAARDFLLHGELLPVETVSIFNLWNDTAFVDEAHWGRQARLIEREPKAAGRREQALRFALLGWRRSPDAGLRKLADGLDYFLRPSEAHQLLVAETPHPSWRHALAIGLGDVPFLLAVPLFAAFAAGGPKSPARTLLVLWLLYYLALLVVVFHTQVRYRTPFTPVLFACAAGGARALAARPRRASIGLLVGLLLVLWSAASQLAAAGRATASAWTLRAARQSLEAGDPSVAAKLALRAASLDPLSARPLVGFASSLAGAGRIQEAVTAYERALSLKPGAWLPLVALPRLLEESGRAEDARRALAAAHTYSREANPWLALEAAWRQLPPPRANEILLGGSDYGAVRGFMAPGPDGRWSRARAGLRLATARAGARHELTIEMGSPEPSPLAAPEVRLRASGGPWQSFVLDREMRYYALTATAAADGSIEVELRAPRWTRPGLPAELGVRVRRLAVAY